MGNYLQHMQQMGQGTAFGRRVAYLRYNFANYLSGIKSNKQKVLELGPGIGELLYILNRKGITNIDIIDNDTAVLKYCQKTYQINRPILEKDLDLTKYVQDEYDLIVLTQVFEHIPKSSYLNWISTLYRSLRPGGHILITVPNGANPLSGTERYGDLQHENIFTVYSFRELMTFSGLKNLSYEIRSFEIPPTSLLNIVRIVLQKILHGMFIVMMMVNGAIYQTLMTPNITLVITKERSHVK